jgi:hypothetical protein
MRQQSLQREFAALHEYKLVGKVGVRKDRQIYQELMADVDLPIISASCARAENLLQFSRFEQAAQGQFSETPFDVTERHFTVIPLRIVVHMTINVDDLSRSLGLLRWPRKLSTVLVGNHKGECVFALPRACARRTEPTHSPWPICWPSSMTCALFHSPVCLSMLRTRSGSSSMPDGKFQ